LLNLELGGSIPVEFLKLKFSIPTTAQNAGLIVNPLHEAVKFPIERPRGILRL